MSRTPLDLLNLFVEFPGDLLFFLLVIAISQGSLFLAFGHRSRFPFELSTRRFVFATSGLVVVWLGMLAAAFLSQRSDLDANIFMPPLERLAFSVTLLVMAWSFLSTDFIRWKNRSNLLVFSATFVLALIYINSAQEWLSVYSAETSFNSTEFAPIWSGVLAAIGALGLLLTLFNFAHVVDAPLKILFFLLFALGNGFDLYQFSQGDVAGNYLGAARLAYLAGLAMLPLIIYRLAVALLENSLVEVVLAASQPTSAILSSQPIVEEAAVSVDPLMAAPASWNFAASAFPSDRRELINAIGVMLDARQNAGLPEQVVKATIESLKADVCVLLRLQDNDYADVIAGRDQVADRSISDISLNLSEQPTVLDAARHGEQTILFPEYHSEELTDLFKRLSIASLSSVYVQPLRVEGELTAVLLVSMPYRKQEFAPEEMEALRDLGFVAARVLAWSFDAAAAAALAEEQAIDAIAGKPVENAMDRDALIAVRTELEASLGRATERMEQLNPQIAELKGQLQQQQQRLLATLTESGDVPGAIERLHAIFDEQANLSESVETGAQELLDGETILRILNINDGETVAQLIREYLHKQLNLMLIARDRLRRQINALLVMSSSDASEGTAAILQAATDEAAQLALERDQQQSRLASILSKLESMGIATGFSSVTHLLLQLYAERKTLSQQLADVAQDRGRLLSEREKKIESGGSDIADLERQLKHLKDDHEQLLNSREDLRREQQEMLEKIEVTETEKAELRAENEALNATLMVEEDKQQAFNETLSSLEEERDNLLSIRDQLTARITAMDSADVEADDESDDQIAKLQTIVDRLTEQREQLALELSDARSELSATKESYLAIEAGAAETTVGYQVNKPEHVMNMVQELRAPMTSISDYTDLLLAESIGILGAAQLQVLQMISADIRQLTGMIGDLQKLAQLDVARFSLNHGEVDLVSIIEDVIDETTPQIGEKGLLVELSLGNELPPISADSTSLRHILLQLVTNASAVSPRDTQITVSANAGSILLPEAEDTIEAVEVRVQDKGGGIPPTDVPRVFARKYRSENPTISGFGDTGVSMTVARALARAHEGDLWVTSEPGEGSIFHLALPLHLAAAPKD